MELLAIILSAGCLVGLIAVLVFLLLSKTSTDKQRAADEATLQTSLEAQAQYINNLTSQMDNLRNSLTDRLTRDSKIMTDRMTQQMGQIDQKLAAVHQGLGEMQGLAASVGDLRKVLSNVKTRGNLGEVQLEALLAEILAPAQYEKNVATKPRSNKRVEFAVHVPTDDGSRVLLPIDSKFPGDTYAAFVDAQETNNPELVEAARKALTTTIKNEAKDISEKYIAPPHTPPFAIMFLPFEGLYAEVVQQPNLLETLQRDYSVTIAGPSTMVAILNSLQMSYQTIAIQKQTNDILQVLQAVKAEMPVYRDRLIAARRQLRTLEKTLDELITTRTNVMERKLKDLSLPEQYRTGAKEVKGKTVSKGAIEATSGDAVTVEDAPEKAAIDISDGALDDVSRSTDE